ncbi:hypothetical protein Sarmat_00459 [Rickettsiales endosymbiont of Paramecium tredecaurelia]|uniref:hypothetical protein n=1 Tax=Candidatus Sarmatiella mevalonica TaxID=2770581 RepID=UPI001920D96E|nr:hypothetical protein [Candidatus Sarmatiella mevalonica]MBL3284609.1 hypothetical protein [Candidatus Sarmatiella mevalonica]
MQTAIKVRKLTYNLAIPQTNELQNSIYFDGIKEFICCFEGIRLDTYLDGIPDPDNPARFISAKKFYSLSSVKQNQLRKQCIERGGRVIATVGVGANIDSKETREELDKVLKKKDFMEKVYQGVRNLSHAETMRIFAHHISCKVAELHKIYLTDWHKLRGNERIAILSLYFNSPKLVGGTTRFRSHIKQYIQTRDVAHLKNAVDEVVNHSNPRKHHAVQRRRDSEGALLASYECA